MTVPIPLVIITAFILVILSGFAISTQSSIAAFAVIIVSTLAGFVSIGLLPEDIMIVGSVLAFVATMLIAIIASEGI